MRRTALHVSHALLEHLKNFPLKAEIFGRGKADRRVLDFEVFHLALDAFHQCAVEQVVGQNRHLRHAQQALPLHYFFQARVGDAGKGHIHQLVLAFLHHPTRHFGHLAIGMTV